MSNFYQGKFRNENSELQSESFFLEFDSNGCPQPPSEGFVISRDASGNILSIYGDNIWDLTPYSTASGKCRYYFKTDKTDKTDKTGSITNDYIQQLKWLMVCLMYIIPTPIAAVTLRNYQLSLRRLAIYCQGKQIHELAKVLSSCALIKKFFQEVNLKPQSIQIMLTLRKHLFNVGFNKTGFKIVIDQETDNLQYQLNKVSEQKRNQAYPIPSRIYLARVNQLNELLKDFQQHKAALITIFRDCLKDKNYGYSIRAQRRRKINKQDYRPTFDEVFREHGLTMFAQKHGLVCMRDFSAYLTKIKTVSKHQIHLYSGMRSDEVKLLRYDCLEEKKMNWGAALFIKGVSTKIFKRRKLSRWVTSPEVKSAIDTAQSITEVVAEHYGYKRESCSLFISHTVLIFPEYINTPDDGTFFNLSKYEPKSVMITQSDIDELERIEISTDWHNHHEIKVGEDWPFRSHQYRRSLAVYGSNSGLIDLPSLKFQLKQISDNMALYYSQGSQRALDILGNVSEQHFVKEYQKQKPITEALVFIYDYLMSDEPLIGGQGILTDKVRTKGSAVILEDREITMRRFAKGELAFKDTPLGACTSTEKCDSRLNLQFTACIKCPSAILKKSKIDKWEREIEYTMKDLPVNSVEFRIENEQLQDLKRLKIKLENQERDKEVEC